MWQENDDYETDEGSGDGFDSVIIRIALILSDLPWDSALEDISSSKFNEVSRNLRSEISNIYANFPGRQIVTVLNYHRSSQSGHSALNFGFLFQKSI